MVARAVRDRNVAARVDLWDGSASARGTGCVGAWEVMRRRVGREIVFVGRGAAVLQVIDQGMLRPRGPRPSVSISRAREDRLL